MTPAQLKQTRATLGLTQSQLAARLRLSNDRIIRRWEAGDHTIPGSVEVALCYMLHGTHPDNVDGWKSTSTP